RVASHKAATDARTLPPQRQQRPWSIQPRHPHIQQDRRNSILIALVQIDGLVTVNGQPNSESRARNYRLQDGQNHRFVVRYQYSCQVTAFANLVRRSPIRVSRLQVQQPIQSSDLKNLVHVWAQVVDGQAFSLGNQSFMQTHQCAEGRTGNEVHVFEVQDKPGLLQSFGDCREPIGQFDCGSRVKRYAVRGEADD